MPDATPVREVMTRDVVTLRPDQPVAEAADVLAGKQIGAAPVVDADGKLVGLLRDEDLIVSEARLHVPTVISFLGADLVLPSSLHHFEHELKKAAGSSSAPSAVAGSAFVITSVPDARAAASSPGTPHQTIPAPARMAA